MFKRSIMLRLRALWRNRAHAIVNVVGLSLGITSAIVIFLIVRFERSFDRFREDENRIYRVVCKSEEKNVAGYSSAGTYPLVPAMRADFADVEYASLVDTEHTVILVPRAGGVIDKFQEDRIVFVDSSYFRIIDQKWLMGNPESLAKAKTVVLTESIARKYFGDEDPLNRVINYNSDIDLTVTGVIEDAPENTDFRFDIYITSNLGSYHRGWDDWDATASDVNCIIKLRAGITRQQMEAKMDGWHMKYFADDVGEGATRTYLLQPLSEMHFDQRFSNPGGKTIASATLLTLVLIGSVLLVTACINFINLNTVLIMDRSREAGVRKVMGSTRAQLIIQFLSETVLIASISMLISSGLVELMIISLQPILGYRLAFHPLTDLSTSAFMLALITVVTLLAGLYPAIKLSAFQPIRALKNRIGGESKGGFSLRRSLIVFQLVISQVLIVSTVIVVRQIDHFMSQPLGISSESVIEFTIPEQSPEKMRTLSERMKQLPGVLNFAASNTGSISDGQWGAGFEATVGGKLVQEGAIAKIADHNYLDTYGISLIAGERLIESDTATMFLINEKLCQTLGYKNAEEALGTRLRFWGKDAYVAGVIKDFNASPLRQRVRPVIIFSDANAYSKGAVLMSAAHMDETRDQVRSVWEDLFPKYVYEEKFLDETISKFYDGERRVSYLVGLFASIAIFIGCIGLFGLISFMARQKTKEIGIRKTLGATVAQVMALFSREFVLLISISFLLSVPITYYFMSDWLSNFEYRIAPGVLNYILGVIIISVIVLATVGFRSYNAARANPVDALRDE